MKHTILLCLFISAYSLTYTQKITWLEGSWRGEGYQPNAATQQIWDIKLQYNYKEKLVDIKYPSLNCGGKWAFKSKEKNKAVFVENLNYGLDRCGNGGVLVVSYIDKQYISIAYYDPFDKATIIATGLLKKN